MFVGCGIMNATQLTLEQQKAKKEIYSALKKYGTNITDSGEEYIMFQYNRITYLVSVNVLDPQTLYLALSTIFTLPKDYDSTIANNAAFNAALNKPVCSYSKDGNLAFSCEMYAKRAKPFIEVLPNMLEALRLSAENFQKEYDKVAKEGSTATQGNNMITIESSKNEYIFPRIESRGDSKLYIEKVTLSKTNTVLDMISYNSHQYQWCSISKNSYITANGIRYPLNRADGIAYAPQHTDYPNYQSGKDVPLHFKLFFSALPEGTPLFDFSEGLPDGWHISGVELKHGKSFAINGETHETEFHKWSCNAVEIQDGQTIVTKTVIPKENGTYMYSSQDEYIEDADTGRKYYLLNSSIGFEGSPAISHDKEAITFYEVYPALPQTVKRINISSGSKYYVKNLNMR